MSTGVGGTISATKNKPGEATVNGKPEGAFLPRVRCKPVCSEPFPPESDSNTSDSTLVFIAVSLPFSPPVAPPLPRPSTAG